jgi:hypothetical protein
MIPTAKEGRRWRPLAERLVGRPDAPNEREFHDDIRDLDDGTLRVERARLRLAILLSEHPDRWALERLVRVVAEIEARRAR